MVRVGRPEPRSRAQLTTVLRVVKCTSSNCCFRKNTVEVVDFPWVEQVGTGDLADPCRQPGRGLNREADRQRAAHRQPRSVGIPPDFLGRKARYRIDYGYVPIGDGTYMLPVRARYSMEMFPPALYRHDVAWGDCRRFDAESILTFGDLIEASR